MHLTSLRLFGAGSLASALDLMHRVGSTLGQEFSGGRENRLSIGVIVQLAPVDGALTHALVEVGYTLNISACGACVVLSHPWRIGDLANVTSLNDRTTLRGNVAHCEKCSSNRYKIGLNFREQTLQWSVFTNSHAKSW